MGILAWMSTNSALLRIYDFLALGVFNFWVWRCPTGSILLPFFNKHIGEGAHLDVAVGTGYYPATSVHRLSKCKNVALLDTNPRALDVAAARLRAAGYKGAIEKVHHSVFESLPNSLRGKFDSISIFYTLNRLPGSFPPKASHVFAVLSAGLAPDGVLYGATILGKTADHTLLSRALLWLYNRRGWFGNKVDSVENLEKALRGMFEEVQVRVVGVVALFEARRPIPR
ncbi:uncharacterized protein B0H18DRAFT_223285 [Fomitopsis serialis]|uniref:uncharacterized protein n=1 Tax=Fomitopsis serialis TaxID=139415 RepID=UPI0020074BC2|nr:uncharacterized protein B0H18DRAFT_223285 [Neoantrodia serialis]KAH9929254.1 hypothetical protein B0H18DRAFT_223285 [Neoantrodia serialis]